VAFLRHESEAGRWARQAAAVLIEAARPGGPPGAVNRGDGILEAPAGAALPSFQRPGDTASS
jgi:hypothetical protein